MKTYQLFIYLLFVFSSNSLRAGNCELEFYEYRHRAEITMKLNSNGFNDQELNVRDAEECREKALRLAMRSPWLLEYDFTLVTEETWSESRTYIGEDKAVVFVHWSYGRWYESTDEGFVNRFTENYGTDEGIRGNQAFYPHGVELPISDDF